MCLRSACRQYTFGCLKYLDFIISLSELYASEYCSHPLLNFRTFMIESPCLFIEFFKFFYRHQNNLRNTDRVVKWTSIKCIFSIVIKKLIAFIGSADFIGLNYYTAVFCRKPNAERPTTPSMGILSKHAVFENCDDPRWERFISLSFAIFLCVVNVVSSVIFLW